LQLLFFITLRLLWMNLLLLCLVTSIMLWMVLILSLFQISWWLLFLCNLMIFKKWTVINTEILRLQNIIPILFLINFLDTFIPCFNFIRRSKEVTLKNLQWCLILLLLQWTTTRWSLIIAVYLVIKSNLFEIFFLNLVRKLTQIRDYL